jgi:putative ABC transport system permease protein
MHGFFFIRIIQVGFKSLRLHKLRSMLTMLGMIIGVWAVITLVAIGEGASHDAQEAIKSLGAKNVIIRSIKPPSMRTQMHGNWESFFRRWMAVYGLKRQDAVQIEKTVPGVKRVLPMLTKRMNAVHGTREVDCQLIGTFPYYPEFTQAEMVVGQFLNEEEENSKVSSCVISLSLAERLFAGHNPLLEKIVVRGYESSQVFQVKGVLQERVDAEKLPQLADSLGRTITANVYVPLSTFNALYGVKNVERSVGNLKLEAVELTEIRVEFESVEQVLSSLPLIHEALHAGRDERDFEIVVPIRELNALRKQKARDTRMLLYIACISLLVGGIGIMNIMLATVTERTREIGVRRALGATQGDITMQFLVETLMLCLIGGGVGVVGGWLFAAFRHNIMHTTTIVTEWSVLLAFGLSVSVGLIFGIYPARRAAHLDPIEALRHA